MTEWTKKWAPARSILMTAHAGGIAVQPCPELGQSFARVTPFRTAKLRPLTGRTKRAGCCASSPDRAGTGYDQEGKHSKLDGADVRPVVVSACADCGVGTHTIGEWYMVKDDVWDQAWRGRRKSWSGKAPGQEVLCIGCLEARLGRTLTAGDFTNAMINDPRKNNMSKRLRDRLTRRRRASAGMKLVQNRRRPHAR
jgi:hypothetical protein